MSTNEDTAYSFTSADFNFNDIDGDILSQIRIDSLPENGSLTLSGVAVALNQLISAADINSGNLRFTPDANANGVGYANFNFSVHDGIGFSLAGATMTIDVVPMNDFPTTNDKTININENGIYTFSTTDFNFNDVDGDALNQIRITTLPINGALTLSGIAVGLNQVISVADINAGNLKFIPTTNTHGISYSTFNFMVHDGTSFSLLSATITIDVTKTNNLASPENTAIANPPPENTTPEENTKDNDTTNNNPIIKDPVSYNPKIHKNQNHILNIADTSTVNTLKIFSFNLNYQNEFDFNHENNAQSIKNENNNNYQDLKVKNQFSTNAFLSTLENIQISYNAYFTQLYNQEIMLSSLKDTLTVTGLTIGLIATPWILNATTLLASLCASATIWSSIDPLPIAAKKKHNSTHENSVQDNIDKLFDKK